MNMHFITACIVALCVGIVVTGFSASIRAPNWACNSIGFAAMVAVLLAAGVL